MERIGGDGVRVGIEVVCSRSDGSLTCGATSKRLRGEIQAVTRLDKRFVESN